MEFSIETFKDIPIYWALIIIGTLVNTMPISNWWYMVFGKQWMKSIGKTEQQIREGQSVAVCMLIETFSRFLNTFGFYVLIYLFNLQSMCNIFLMATWLGVIFIVLPLLQPLIWERNNINYVIICGVERMLSLYLVALYFYYYNPNTSIQEADSQQQQEEVLSN